ncbi:MAG: tandem-95 repeat protein, partial [Deltaproteobacteria bacterium]
MPRAPTRTPRSRSTWWPTTATSTATRSRSRASPSRRTARPRSSIRTTCSTRRRPTTTARTASATRSRTRRAASTDEDSPVTVDVVANDSDVDGDALAIASITQPAHGSAAIADGHHVTYTPAADYNGPDAFRYTISDGNGGQASATVAITVSPVNDAPVAVADAASLDEDTQVTIDVVANDSDVDGDALAIASITQPAHGTAAIAERHHVVALAIAPVNDAPVAAADAASTDEDTSITVDVVANDADIDGDALAITSLTPPAHGAAFAVDGHRVLYVPAANYHGPDALSYTISDGNGGQATAQLVLDVVSVNDAPVAVADAASLDEDTSATIDVVANDSDVDGDTLAVASVTQPAHGTAAIVGLHQVSYTPA